MNRPRVLRLTSCQAQNSEFIGRAMAPYIGKRLGMATQFIDGIPWQKRERLLDDGTIHAGWICGLPYVLKADRRRPSVELLATQVMAAKRYVWLPLYFFDIVGRHDHRGRSFRELRGSRWGYNERQSHSGYEIVRYQLARLGERGPFFGETVEAGTHQATLQMILDGTVDA